MIERIKAVRKEFSMNQMDFSKKIKMSQSAYASLELGRTTIRDRHISLICTHCNVSEEWILTGKGQMFNVVNDNINFKLGTELTKIISKSDDVLKKLIISLSELNYDELIAINNIVDILIKKKEAAK
ncbi:MAG: helix-turn-helix domain-containing protein [Cetobacterium sp.]